MSNEALEKSIKKWEDIVAGHGVDAGTFNCALCQAYRTQAGCEGCPVKERTRMDYCSCTPYGNFDEFTREEYVRRVPISNMLQDIRTKATQLAQAELDFLKSLRTSPAEVL
jgi:hypothetical protein